MQQDRKKQIFTAVLIVFSILLLEISSYVIVAYVFKPFGIYYDKAATPTYENIKKNWDQQLGWIPSSQMRDQTGARFNPYFSETESSCISVYGESAVLGSDVEDEYAWSNLLSKKLGCRVSNYGVGAYGTDQALLTYLRNDSDRIEIVMLGMPPSNISRNVNQFRMLLPHNRQKNRPRFGLKPRYILDDQGYLKLIPIPILSLNESNYADLIEQPEMYLKHEYFQINGDTGLSRISFPYSLSLFRGVNSLLVLSKLQNKTWYEDMYDENHASNSLAITEAILAKFYQNALQKNKMPIILILPTANDIKSAKQGEPWIYQSLLDRLDKHGYVYLNVGEQMMTKIDNRDPCEFFVKHCIPHPNVEGSTIISDIIAEFLDANKLSAYETKTAQDIN